MVGLGSIHDTRGPEKPMLGLDPNCDTCVGSPNIPKLTGPIRFEVGESSSLADSRSPTHKAHDSVMVASSKTQQMLLRMRCWVDLRSLRQRSIA